MRNHEIPQPDLPGDDRVTIKKTTCAGICGSDLGVIRLHTCPYYSPLSSFPNTLGHEGLGTICRS